MRVAKMILLLLVRLLLACVVAMDVLMVFGPLQGYWHGGIQGARNAICFPDLHFHQEPFTETPEELVHHVQKAYESFALGVIILVALTWLGFKAEKRIMAWIRASGADSAR